MIETLRDFAWRFAPKVELAKLKPIDFFPPTPSANELARLETICLGSKTRTIGDSLALSTLPAKLKAAYPKLEIRIYPRGFNPVVFYGNPAVAGLQYLPERVYGDDNCLGSGHLLQLKEQAFGLPVGNPPRPEIHLLEREGRWADAYLDRHSKSAKPLCLIHPWGHTWKNIAPKPLWDGLIRRWSHAFRFWQLGIKGHDRLEGCEHHLLLPKARRHARKLFAITARARVFVGVNSGPMHVARAFSVPSLVLTDQGQIGAIFKLRRENPYFLRDCWKHAFLYEENAHLDLSGRIDSGEVAIRLDAFLESRL